MFSIKTSIDLGSTPYITHRELSLQRLELLHQRLKQVAGGGGAAAVARHTARGKLTARQRIELLLDRDTPFLELSALAAWDQYNQSFPSAGIITGIGTIHGKAVMVVANDATVKGGTYTHETVKKHLRAQEIASELNLTCIYMVDSGGAFLPEQSRVFPDRDHFGRIFYNQARLSAKGIAQIAMVMGSCTAGGAYIPAMSDETIIVDNQGTIFLAGPPLVKAATGEEVTAEELGGGRVHTTISGVADHLADNDVHAIHLCRNIMESIPGHRPKWLQGDAPLLDPSQIHALIPDDQTPWPDVHEILARLLDGSRFHPFKPDYGATLVTGFGTIGGHTVGILANNGVLFSESAQKGAHFIQLCNARRVPMVFLQNITGFMVGKHYEHMGIAKDGAKMVNALANSVVPIITIVMGGSYGAGNYAMAGRAYNPAFLFMWPNARISVMGAKQAADVLTAIKSDSPTPEAIEARQQLKAEIINQYESEGSAYYSTSRLWDDGIIDPSQTRNILQLCLSLFSENHQTTPNYGIFRM